MRARLIPFLVAHKGARQVFIYLHSNLIKQEKYSKKLISQK
jgi:hypothetical protein